MQSVTRATSRPTVIAPLRVLPAVEGSRSARVTNPARLVYVAASVTAATPRPMLARSETLASRGRRGFEVKWDGFRAIVRTGDDYRVRSRRGWDTTQLVPELQQLPAGVYDGELVAFDDGIPWLPD